MVTNFQCPGGAKETKKKRGSNWPTLQHNLREEKEKLGKRKTPNSINAYQTRGNRRSQGAK